MVSVVSQVETGHEDMVHDAALDYYGLRLATCSSDHSVRVMDVRGSQGSQQSHLAAELKGHSAPVWQVAWAHPRHGTMLASCSYDRKVIVWREGADWTKAYEYANHESSVNSVCWAPAEYGAALACASSDGSVSVLTKRPDADAWDAVKIPGAHAVGCNAVAWCPHAPDSPRRLVTGGSDNLVKIWLEDGDRWTEETRLEFHTDWIRDVAWAPNVGSPRSTIASCSQDKRVVVWTSEDNVSWTSTVLHAFDDVVWSVSWSLTGNVLAVSGGDNKVSLWRENNEGQWTCISEVARGIGTVADDDPAPN